MADTKLDVILRLKDEMSDKLRRSSQAVEDFGRATEKVGKNISNFSNKLGFLGTSMTAPFILAAKSVEKFSFGVQTELKRTENTWLQFNNTLAQAALPTIKQFNDNFARLVNTMNAINPKLMEQIVHWTIVTGGILLAAFAVGKLIGTLITLGGTVIRVIGFLGVWNFAILAIVAVVGGLVLAWTKFHDQFIKILDAIEVAFLKFVDFFLIQIEKLLEASAVFKNRPPALDGLPFIRDLRAMGGAVDGAIQKIKSLRGTIDKEIGSVGAGGKSALSTGLENMVSGATSGFDNLVNAWNNSSTQMGTMMEDLKLRAKDLAYQISDGFADAFDKALFEGKRFVDSVKDMFKQLARDILKDFLSTSMKNAMNAMFFQGSQTESGSGIGGALAGQLANMTNLSTSTKNASSAMSQAATNTGNMAATAQKGTSQFGNFFDSMKAAGSGMNALGMSLLSASIGIAMGQAIGGENGLAGQQGRFGMLGAVVGGLGGFLIGGPWGAVIGAGIGGMAGGMFHEGGMIQPIVAHSGLAPDEVPIIAQTGEGVLSRRGMAALGGSDNLRRLNRGRSMDSGGTNQTVVVNQMIQAWDASDVLRNKKAIVAAIAEEMKQNGSLRRVMKEI